MKLAGRWRNVERRGPRTHIRGQLMATIADSSPLTESTLLRALIAVWVLFDAYGHNGIRRQRGSCCRSIVYPRGYPGRDTVRF